MASVSAVASSAWLSVGSVASASAPLGSVSAPLASASIAISGSFSFSGSGLSRTCCCDGGFGNSIAHSNISCDEATFSCPAGECQADGCPCECIPGEANLNLSLSLCCGSFGGNVPMSNGGSGCTWTGTIELCGQKVTITVSNPWSITIGGGCIPTKSGTITGSSCNPASFTFTIQWSNAELSGCPGC